MLRPNSRASASTLPQSSLRATASVANTYSQLLLGVSTPDTEQHLDVYELEIDAALDSMGIAGVPSLREHQASAIAQALINENIFFALATGAGKSLCFQISAIVQACHHQKVTVVIQPTLEIIASQVRALSAHGIDVEIISSLTSSDENNALGTRLNQEAYRPALIYMTFDSFFGHYSYVFTTLRSKGALARIILDEGHTILHWKEFRPLMASLPFHS